MQKRFVFFLLVISMLNYPLFLKAQNVPINDTTTFVIDTVPPYVKNPHIPTFKIQQPDSSYLTNTELPKNKPLVIFYFSPWCPHCQQKIEELSKKMDDFTTATLIFVSYQKLHDIDSFCVKHNLTTYNNVRVGRDVDYALPPFYKMQFIPFIAVYDKEGILTKTFPRGCTPLELKESIMDDPNKK